MLGAYIAYANEVVHEAQVKGDGIIPDALIVCSEGMLLTATGEEVTDPGFKPAHKKMGPLAAYIR